MRQRARRRRRRIRRIIVLVAVLSLAASGYALTRSRLFGISDIEVVGSSSRDTIVDASGLKVGQNIMGLNTALVAERIERLPLVADATVVREGALGIRITIVERHAALEVRSGSLRWFIAQDGTAISVAPEVPIPVLLLPAGATPQGETTASVLEIWRALPKGLRARLISFRANPEGSIAFVLGDVDVVFGHGQDVRAKVRALRLVLERFAASGQTLARVDLRSPSRPSVRIR